MKTDQDRLRWAVAFAALPGGDPAIAGKAGEVNAFLSLKSAPLLAVPDTNPAMLHPADLRRLHSDASVVLSSLTQEGALMLRTSVEKLVLPRPPATKRGKPPTPLLVVSGAVRDVFLEVLYYLLLTLPTDLIRSCPGCRKMFVRSGRQTHCTSECYDRAYWSSLSPERVERYREKQYEAGGWVRGARSQQRTAPATKLQKATSQRKARGGHTKGRRVSNKSK